MKRFALTLAACALSAVPFASSAAAQNNAPYLTVSPTQAVAGSSDLVLQFQTSARTGLFSFLTFNWRNAADGTSSYLSGSGQAPGYGQVYVPAALIAKTGTAYLSFMGSNEVEFDILPSLIISAPGLKEVAAGSIIAEFALSDNVYADDVTVTVGGQVVGSQPYLPNEISVQVPGSLLTTPAVLPIVVTENHGHVVSNTLNLNVVPPQMSGTLTLPDTHTAMQLFGFDFQPVGSGTPVTLSAFTRGDGNYALTGIVPGSYTVLITGEKVLSKRVPVTIGATPATVNVTLAGGDATLDNAVNFDDFLTLLDVFGSSTADSNNAYSFNADFNGDGKVDFDDFLILLSSYGTHGDN